MNDEQKKLYEERTRIIKALAHPSRLFIVEELQKGDKCVNELTEMIGADVSTVSKHLSVLKSAGIVSDRKEKNNIFYNLRTPCVLNFMGCIEEVIQSNAIEQIELLKCCRK